MKKMSFVVGALVSAPAFAQLPLAVNPSPPLPAVVYRSVFTDPPAGVETQPNLGKDAAPPLKMDEAARSTTATRKAWIRAVAAQQSAQNLRDAKDAAEAGAELAQRMARAGNWTRLEQAREQVFLAETLLELARAEQTAFVARERLARLMGTPGSFALAARLPDIPQTASTADDIEARVLAVTRGQTDTAVLRIRSEVREAYFGYRTAYDLAVYYRDDIVPLHKRIHDELVLRYNGMLASVWELLADARQQVQAANSTLDAQRDFWLAEADLQAAIVGTRTDTPSPSGH